MKKMYVIVRNNLPTKYRMVQGAHAVAEFLLCGPETEWDNGTMVFVSVPDTQILKEWVVKLNRANKHWIGFAEPDLDNELTSIACVDTGEIFKELRLAQSLQLRWQSRAL